MINLLAPETKRQLRAAHTNVTLYHYSLLVLFTAILLASVFGMGFWADYHDRTVAEQAKARTDSDAQAYADTRKLAESFANDVATAKTILASNVSFSQLILDIAALVPQGVILNNLTLGDTTSSKNPLDISGRANSYNGAVALKNSLEASSIFENVSIASITQSDTSSQSASNIVKQYPFTVNIKANFTASALNGQGASK